MERYAQEKHERKPSPGSIAPPSRPMSLVLRSGVLRRRRSSLLAAAETSRDTLSEQVYAHVKALVIAFAFPPGERIMMGPIAEALGTSTMPVREALNRLVAEGLVIKAPKKGFIAKGLSETTIRQCYVFNQRIAGSPPVLAQFRDPAPIEEDIERILRDLDSNARCAPKRLADHTGSIFLLTAARTQSESLVTVVRSINDNLHYLRTVKNQWLESAPKELAALCELILAGDRDGWLSAVDEYHRSRVRLLPELFKMLRPHATAS